MRCGRGGAWLCSLWLLVACFAFPWFSAQAAGGDAVSESFANALLNKTQRVERAVLIGVDDFVSRPSTYPSSTNNVYAMQETFQLAREPLKTLLIPSHPVTSAERLAQIVQDTFAQAREEDVSYLYISTHSEYDPQSGEEPALLLSDGITEGRITAAELEEAFRGIAGTKVLILDACNSGAFIGKGEPNWDKPAHFLGDDFKVLTSSGALEESWYWNAVETQVSPQEQPTHQGEPAQPPPPGNPKPKRSQGAFYFTQELSQSLSPRYGYPADGNHDGLVTLTELYTYLLDNHSASTPQVYPQQDDFVVFRYDAAAELPTGSGRSPILDVTFSGTMLDQAHPSVTLEYIATRPVRVAYQIVYQKDGKWRFDEAQLLYDEVERFTAFGDQEGAVAAGRKVRTLSLNLAEQDAYGYMMVQLLSIDRGKVTIHAGRVFCVPPAQGDLRLSVKSQEHYDRKDKRELAIFVEHAFPCALSVAMVNEQNEVVARLCHRRGTRPTQTEPAGSLFYWDGTDRNGNPVPKGTYRIRASGAMNQLTFTVMSKPIVVE